MGKYTSLAEKVEEAKPQKKCVGKGLDNTYKHSTLIDTYSNPTPPSSEGATNLRTTNLTNLILRLRATSPVVQSTLPSGRVPMVICGTDKTMFLSQRLAESVAG
jgi:hypothetical protein